MLYIIIHKSRERERESVRAQGHHLQNSRSTFRWQARITGSAMATALGPVVIALAALKSDGSDRPTDLEDLHQSRWQD